MFFTANDAHMRRYRVTVPADCVASEREEDRRYALRLMRRLLAADTRPRRNRSEQRCSDGPFRVSREHGRPVPSRLAPTVIATTHPASILRIRAPTGRAPARRAVATAAGPALARHDQAAARVRGFVADLRVAARQLAVSGPAQRAPRTGSRVACRTPDLAAVGLAHDAGPRLQAWRTVATADRPCDRCVLQLFAVACPAEDRPPRLMSPRPTKSVGRSSRVRSTSSRGRRIRPSPHCRAGRRRRASCRAPSPAPAHRAARARCIDFHADRSERSPRSAILLQAHAASPARTSRHLR